MIWVKRACNPRVFGSVLQGCDTEECDLDLLIDPTSEGLRDVRASAHTIKTLREMGLLSSCV
jgi:predicted nucleotidyltransferase